MPMRARSFGSLVAGSPTEMPSTTMRPCSNGSSPLTHLISVDLPEPDGPHTTTTSPLATLVEQSVSTWKVPYHLLTWLISIMVLLPDDGDARLQTLDQAGCGERNQKVDERREQVHLDQAAVALRDLGGGAQEIRDREHVDQRGVLEQDDRLRQQHGRHIAERLRQDDVAHHLPIGHAERIAGGRLPARDALDSRAH